MKDETVRGVAGAMVLVLGASFIVADVDGKPVLLHQDHIEIGSSLTSTAATTIIVSRS